MSKRESLGRCNLIIQKLRKKPATFQEIADFLARESELQGYDFNIAQRTFQRDLEEIRSLFNIDIQYNFSRKVYNIVEEEHANISARILESYNLFNALQQTERIATNIYFEERIPQGTEHFNGLIHAIRHRKITTFDYHKFWQDTPRTRRVAPLALKEFKSRWYLVALDLDDDKKLKTFGLDRISELHFLRETFENPPQNLVSEQFQHCFGVINELGKKPQNIVLSFTPFQGKYVLTMPLHHSQEILIDNEKELRIQLFMQTTHDFLMELLHYGDQVKVLEPKSLVNTVKKELLKALRRYED
jgi:predicted DNA-binding transcriptional regulator YafY